MKKAYINHTEDVDFPKETALYLARNKLAGMHYQELPITTSTGEYDGYSGTTAFDSFCDYTSEDYIVGVRNNAHPDLTGGMMVGDIPSSEQTTQRMKPLGLVLTLSDPDDLAASAKERYNRLKGKAKDLGPKGYETVLADIPLDEGLSGEEIISQLENQKQ